jgi:hypothetical protein
MEKTLSVLREERLQQLFADCRQQVIAQIIGPFGLSTAMFEDKNGGNVTTLHNFKREDDDYVATDSDRKLHEHSKKTYNASVRADYEVDTQTKADNAGGKTWDDKRKAKISQGRDEYTGGSVSQDGEVTLKSGKVLGAELDHVVSISEIHQDPKMHLALGQVQVNKDSGDAAVDVSRLREIANHDDNLALTNQSLNGSKSDLDLKEWAERERKDGSDNKTHFEVDEKLMQEKYDKAKKHIDNTADRALLKKQATELLETGGKQAIQMGLRQALGLLLTELVNGLFNEFKVLIKHGVEAGKSLFEEIRSRLARVISNVAKKIPDAVSQLLEGGVSGFMSNLLTFLLNNFLSTAKRFVTVIREGLLGLFRALKMIFFPPEHLTADQALQEGLKILSAVVVSSVGLVLNETVATFMLTVPFLKPMADIVTPVLMGIMTGLLSAFLAYQIDCLFDRYRYAMDEKQMDEMMADAKRRDDFSNELVKLSESSLSNVDNYAKSISFYQSIGVTIGEAGSAAAATLAGLEQSVTETSDQVEKSTEMIEFINSSQSRIEDFLNTL